MSCLLSIMIFTRNRSSLVQELLQTFTLQNANPNQYEIGTVDNASSDDTPNIYKKYAGQLPNLRYVYEEKVGLSHARNQGWQKATGIYIGYLDDECTVPAKWVETALRIAHQIQPDAFCGPYYPRFHVTRPRWFKDEYESYSGETNQRLLQPGEFPNGGNMFIRRDWLENLGGFRPDLGMAGSKIAFGEETQFFKKMRECKPDCNILYGPELYLYHLVRPGRTRISNMLKRSFISGRYVFKIFPNEPSLSRMAAFQKSDVAFPTSVNGIQRRASQQGPAKISLLSKLY